VNLWLVAAGVLAGLGFFLAVREILPAAPRLDAALARLERGRGAADNESVSRQAAQRLTAAAPWLPVPSQDLAMLGQDR
jgi:hypothetical protein